MPNPSVQANAEGLPKFDKAKIMRKAWQKFREFRTRYAPWQIQRRIVDASFSNCLKIAWRIAKREMMETAEAEKVLAALGDRVADRVRELTTELMRIDTKPWGVCGYRATRVRDDVISELSILNRNASPEGKYA